MLDLISLLLNLLVIIFNFTPSISIEFTRAVASVAVLIMWMKLFYFCRIFDLTAGLVRMIVEITKDMRNFLFILAIAIVGFGNCFYLLSINNDDDN